MPLHYRDEGLWLVRHDTEVGAYILYRVNPDGTRDTIRDPDGHPAEWLSQYTAQAYADLLNGSEMVERHAAHLPVDLRELESRGLR